MRILDVALSTTFLIITLPLCLIISLTLLITGEHKIFYKQSRVGKGGKMFYLLKFATMLENSPNIGSKNITLNNDPRILPFGSILRKTKLNELPQLLNILCGDMSFVGYRPMTSKNFNYYTQNARIELVKYRPGLTGIGSIFFRDEEKFLEKNEDPLIFYTNQISPYKESLELWYCKNRSMLNYLLLIMLTAYVIIRSDRLILHKFFPTLPKVPSVFIESYNKPISNS